MAEPRESLLMATDLIDNRLNDDFLSKLEAHTEFFNINNPSTRGIRQDKSMIIYLDWRKGPGQMHCVKLTRELAQN